jgi:hypothetical protein
MRSPRLERCRFVKSSLNWPSNALLAEWRGDVLSVNRSSPVDHRSPILGDNSRSQQRSLSPPVRGGALKLTLMGARPTVFSGEGMGSILLTVG